jgi:hypothetical protein
MARANAISSKASSTVAFTQISMFVEHVHGHFEQVL